MKTVLIITLLLISIASATEPREYPYPANPQYQFERTDGRETLKARRLQTLPGKCRSGGGSGEAPPC
jgi:hypothetical protein